MRFGWKDFFYFQKTDRNGIVVLLLLIVLCGILLVNKRSVFNEDRATQQDEALSEFDKFQNEMVDVPTKEKQPPQNLVGGNKASLSKLKEGETIDMNVATIETLQQIPGIGESYARRIYDYKTQLGGFVLVEQLKEVEGFSGKRYDKIAPYLCIVKMPQKLRINKLPKEELAKHPYLSDKQVTCIVEIRQALNKINNLHELLTSSEFTPRDAERLSPYISFD